MKIVKEVFILLMLFRLCGVNAKLAEIYGGLSGGSTGVYACGAGTLMNKVTSRINFLGGRRRIYDIQKNNLKRKQESHILSGKIIVYEVKHYNSSNHHARQYAGKALDLYIELIKEIFPTFRSLNKEEKKNSVCKSIVDALFMAIPNVKFIRINNSDWTELPTNEIIKITYMILKNRRVNLMTTSDEFPSFSSYQYNIMDDDESRGEYLYSEEDWDDIPDSKNDPVIFDYRTYRPSPFMIKNQESTKAQVRGTYAVAETTQRKMV